MAQRGELAPMAILDGEAESSHPSVREIAFSTKAATMDVGARANGPQESREACRRAPAGAHIVDGAWMAGVWRSKLAPGRAEPSQ